MATISVFAIGSYPGPGFSFGFPPWAERELSWDEPVLLKVSSVQLSTPCFSSFPQILGFDILLTENLKPMLLEVNANPSLRIDYEHELAPGISEYLHSPVDEEIKKSLVLNTLLVVAPKKKWVQYAVCHG